MTYDYKEGKERIKEILRNSAEIQEKEIPKDDTDFTYDNGIKSWIGSIFVDIVGSKNLIEKEESIVVAKVLRAFTSEVISVMNTSENMRQIGIRGDCVYGVFCCPTKKDVYELADLTFYINTLIKMLNKLFTNYGYPNIKVGIGMSIGNDLIVKAGRKGTGINDRIWIGKAVVEACVLADKASRNGKSSIGFSSLAYTNFIELLEKNNSDCRNWFTKYYENGKYEYYGNVIKSGFDKWIEENI